MANKKPENVRAMFILVLKIMGKATEKLFHFYGFFLMFVFWLLKLLEFS